MFEYMMSFLKSFFIYPGVSWEMMLIAVGLAIVFGALWLLGHWPPVFRRPWLWAVAAVSAFLTLLAITFVQIPLQIWVGQASSHFWDQGTLQTWLLLAGVPQILFSGLVQEGAKMVPMVFWWWRSGMNISRRLGLAIGAAAGAGFGIFEAVWAHGRLFSAGWTTSALQTDGFLAIAGFWERFFAVGFHIASAALAGYGLAKGKGWQYYLIASGLHALLNYGVLFIQKGYFTIVQLEVYAAVIAVVVTAAVLLLRWRRLDDEDVED